jgi:hypothetical protein
MRTRAFAVSAGNMDGFEMTVRMVEMLIQSHGVLQSLLIACRALFLKHG